MKHLEHALKTINKLPRKKPVEDPRILFEARPFMSIEKEVTEKSSGFGTFKRQPRRRGKK